MNSFFIKMYVISLKAQIDLKIEKYVGFLLIWRQEKRKICIKTLLKFQLLFPKVVQCNINVTVFLLLGISISSFVLQLVQIQVTFYTKILT